MTKNNKDNDNNGNYFKMEPRRTTCNHQGSPVGKRPGYARSLVYYHKENDLATAFSFGFRPEDATPKKGPGVNADVERQFNPCHLLSDFNYTNWTESIMPLGDNNLAEGLSEALVMIANVAANGTESLKHDDLYLTIQFLSTLRDDNGEVPPNVLAFIEHVDYLTKNDGTEKNEMYPPTKQQKPPAPPASTPATPSKPATPSNPATPSKPAPPSKPVSNPSTTSSTPNSSLRGSIKSTRRRSLPPS